MRCRDAEAMVGRAGVCVSLAAWILEGKGGAVWLSVASLRAMHPNTECLPWNFTVDGPTSTITRLYYGSPASRLHRRTRKGG